MSEKKQLTKLELKKKLANSELEETISLLFETVEAIGDGELYNKVVLQSNRLKHYNENRHLGIIDYDDLTRTRATVSMALLNIIDDLPEAKAEGSGNYSDEEWGISESKLKRRIVQLLIGGKMLLLFFVIFFWQTVGSLTYQGFIGVMGILFSVLGAYIIIIVQNTLDEKHQKSNKRVLRYSKNVRNVAYGVFFLYYFTVLGVLYLHSIGVIPDQGLLENEGYPNYKYLFTALSAIELTFGGGIGLLVNALIKTKNTSLNTE